MSAMPTVDKQTNLYY